VALSDKYLAIGVHDRIMVFSIQDNSQMELPLFGDEFECINPEILKFSAAGD